MGLPKFLTGGNLMTGLQVAGGIAGTIGAVTVTKSLLDDVKEIAPFALAGVAMIGTVYLVTKL